MITWKTK